LTVVRDKIQNCKVSFSRIPWQALIPARKGLVMNTHFLDCVGASAQSNFASGSSSLPLQVPALGSPEDSDVEEGRRELKPATTVTIRRCITTWENFSSDCLTHDKSPIKHYAIIGGLQVILAHIVWYVLVLLTKY